MGTKVLFRRPFAIGLVGGAAMLSMAGLAWACVPQPVVTLEPQGSGPPGSEVKVRGIVFGGDVEIRWNGIDGPLLAKAQGPDFSIPVKVPEGLPGVYSVIAFERAPNGAVGNKAAAPFLLTGVGDEAATPTAPGGSATSEVSPTPSPASSSGDGIEPGLAVAGGVGLLAVGGLGGAVLSRRRARTGAARAA